MPRRVTQAAVVAAVAALETLEGTVWVGVDGTGAAGKSTLASRIAAAVPRVSVVRVDDFSGPRVPEWDWHRLRAQLVLPLLAGRAARYQVWDWDRDVGADWRDVPVGRIVLIEGVSSTRDEVGVPWNLTVWVETPRDVRLARVRERDGPKLLATWLDSWLPSEERYIERQAPQQRVDLIVSGTE